ncbi:hypothetical protein, partial [Nostoc flagelliforme]|uniref:hypothetical protein n=1 Tax=Nostoc flagelliforme TaxID=1306274 RepID=UPI001A7E6BDC
SFRPSCSLLTCSDVKKFLAAGGIVAFKRLPLLIMQLKCRLAYYKLLRLHYRSRLQVHSVNLLPKQIYLDQSLFNVVGSPTYAG